MMASLFVQMLPRDLVQILVHPFVQTSLLWDQQVGGLMNMIFNVEFAALVAVRRRPSGQSPLTSSCNSSEKARLNQ
jgi:hypothetical protein